MKKGSEKKAVKKGAKKNNKSLILAAGAVIAILIVVFLLFQSGILSSYKFSFERGGAWYYSNEYSPVEFFGALKGADEIYVSPELIEGKTNQLVVNSMNLWQVVLISGGQKVVQLVRVYGSAGSQQGSLLYCHTNWGDTNKSVQISAEECGEILSDGGKMKVLIDKSGEDKVVLSKGKMQIFYSSNNTVGSLNLKIIEQVYPGAQETIQRINDIIGQVG